MMKKLLFLALLALALAGCGTGEVKINASAALPTMQPTATAMPWGTPTPYPRQQALAVPDADWDNREPYKASMREGFEDKLFAYENPNRYRIDFELSFPGQLATINGAQRVLYTNTSTDTLDRVMFRLYPNLAAFGAFMSVEDVTMNGEPVSTTLEAQDTALSVPVPGGLAPGETAEIGMAFYVVIEKGFTSGYIQFSYVQDVLAAPEYYPVLSVYDEGEGWWKNLNPDRGDATYSETGHYEVTLTAPSDVVIVLSGEEVSREDNGDGTTSYHYFAALQRDSALFASTDYQELTGEIDGVAVNVYSRDDLGAAEALKMTIDSMRTYNELFGEYPFNEVDVAQTPTRAGGIEYPGVFVVADNYWNPGAPFFEVVIAHEAAHQWWYSVIGNDQTSQPWIDEALTAFTEGVYMEFVKGEKEGDQYVEGKWARYHNYKGNGNRDLVIGMPVTSYDGYEYSTIVYTKGSLFFQTLREELGDEAFFKALRYYFETHSYLTVTPNDVLAAFESVTEDELDGIFYEWVGSFEGIDMEAVAQYRAEQEAQSN